MNQCMSNICIKGCLKLPLYPVVAERSASQRREVLGRLVSYHLFIKRRSSVSSLLISLVIYCHFARDSRLIKNHQKMGPMCDTIFKGFLGSKNQMKGFIW